MVAPPGTDLRSAVRRLESERLELAWQLACVIYGLLGLAAGIHVTVGGYVEQPADSASRWIVTQFILG
jgi:hypothetical protein